MRYTNHYNLPQDVYNACAANQWPPKPNRFGVTDLISPAHIRQLKEKHWDELEVDASTRLWAILGEGVHLVMDNYNRPDGKEVTRKFEAEIDGATIVGIVDSFGVDNDGIITDYKVTSVYSFMGGLKPEWESQLNIYAWLLSKHGIEVKGLRINAILRDWITGKSVQRDYPNIAFQSVSVPLWDLEKTEQFIKNRLTAHRKYGIICNDEERWRKPTTYAVMKKGRKTAVACNSYVGNTKTPFTKEDAQAWIRANGKPGEALYIEERPGSCVRCENYCIVKNFCDFGKSLKG